MQREPFTGAEANAKAPDYYEATGLGRPESRQPDGAYATALSKVKSEKVDWLWEGRIPFGMLSLLIGDPGLGKSLLTVDLAAKMSRSGGDVLLLSAEDHAAVTIRPRAQVAGADLDRVHVVAMKRDNTDDGLAFPDDCDALDAMVEEYAAKLVVIDPLMAHLPDSINSWRDQSVRLALAPLHRIAESRRCAILVVAHLNKAKGADPMYRTGGSIGIPGAVRSALLLARDPDDPDGDRGARRVLAHFKCNIGPYADSLTCEIEDAPVPGEDDLSAPRLTVVGTSQTSGADLLSAPSEEERTERTEAVEILEEELSAGPRRVKEVRAAVLAAGVSPRTLDRAKVALGVVSEKKGFGKEGEWYWELPKGRHDKERHPYLSQVASLEGKGSAEPNRDDADSKGRHGSDMASYGSGAEQEIGVSTQSPGGDGGLERLEAKFGSDL